MGASVLGGLQQKYWPVLSFVESKTFFLLLVGDVYVEILLFLNQIISVFQAFVSFGQKLSQYIFEFHGLYIIWWQVGPGKRRLLSSYTRHAFHLNYCAFSVLLLSRNTRGFQERRVEILVSNESRDAAAFSTQLFGQDVVQSCLLCFFVAV